MAFSRSGRSHPDAMDLWLESQGFYRKQIARDGSCLFRAVAEQLFKSQKFHLEVRNQCVDYLKEHMELFDGHDMVGDIETYLHHMLIPTQWGGMLELAALSKLYQVDFLLFQEIGILAQNVTKNSYSKIIMLCLSPDQQYDSVYSKDFTKVAAFCQSLVYEILYKNIFHMKDVDLAVAQMLHQKAPRHRGELGGCVPRKLFSFGGNNLLLQRRGISLRSLTDNKEEDLNVRELLSKGITPFPYKVAKSLDPNVYRNVELDVWIDYRRGLRFFGSHNELRVGVKCYVNIDDATCIAHIQEMEPNCGPVLVFVEELGEKRSVPYESLELMPQELQVQVPKALPLLSSGNHRNVNSVSKNGALSLQYCSKSIVAGGKSKKRRSSGDEQRSTENGCLSFMDQREGVSGKGHFHAQSLQSFADQDVDSNTDNQGYQDESLSTLSANFQTFNVDNYNNSLQSYQTYHFKDTSAIAGPTHVFMQSQQLGSPPVLIPVSPRPEDIPSHWLSNHGLDPIVISSPADGSNTEFNQSVLNSDVSLTASYASVSPDQMNEVPETSNQESFVKSDSNPIDADVNSNYMLDPNVPNGQINYNAPKSILENGADLPMSDIQTLRYFYNLGNEVYHAQYNMYSFGGYTQNYNQPCASSTPSPAGSPGMCPGKFCSCGPVCITTVPTIHHLLEPSTPPPNTRRRRKDSAASPGGSPLSESDSPSSRNAFQASSSSGGAPRFSKKDAKAKMKKDLKVYQGQPLQQAACVGTSTSLSLNAALQSEEQNGCDPGQGAEPNSSTLAVPYSPSYGYLYCPSSPGVSFSPLEPDPYFTPLRLQCPREYLPDTPQSPPCFSVNGDLYTANQIPMFPSSPHYLFPTSPGVYVGSAPPWTPITPPPPPASAQ